MIKIKIDEEIEVGNICVFEDENKKSYITFYYRDKEVMVRVTDEALLKFGKDYIQQPLSGSPEGSPNKCQSFCKICGDDNELNSDYCIPCSIKD
jgi:hypothetical protein